MSFFFLGGLKEDIHMEVLAFEPPNRQRLISMARLIEQRLARSTSLGTSPSANSTSSGS